MNEKINGITTHQLVLELRDDVGGMRQEMRGRFHDFQETWARLENRIRDLEEFRRWCEEKHRVHDARAQRYIPLIEELMNEDKMTAAVGEAMNKAEARGWSRRERIMGYGLFIFAGLGAIGTVLTILVYLQITPD